MAKSVCVRGVRLTVPSQIDAHYARLSLTDAFSSLPRMAAWESLLRENIAQGRHVATSTALLFAIEQRVGELRIAALQAELRAALEEERRLAAEIERTEAQFAAALRLAPQLIAA